MSVPFFVSLYQYGCVMNEGCWMGTTLRACSLSIQLYHLNGKKSWKLIIV